MKIQFFLTPDELAVIHGWQAHGETLTNAQLVRRQLGFQVQQHGGIRKGGFELGNRLNPRIKEQTHHE